MSFANALVVMTSNVGSAAIAKGGAGLGFQLGDAEEAGYGRVRALVTEELKQFFRCAPGGPPCHYGSDVAFDVHHCGSCQVPDVRHVPL